nr:hypothetical protein [Tanacetum cinerariifolium]
MELDLEAMLMGETLVINRSLEPLNEDYIEFNYLNKPFELRRNQDFAVLKDMVAYHDEGMGYVIVGKPFLKETRIKARRFEGMTTIYNGAESVTYQMVRSNSRFKHHTNEQCNKIPPLLKILDSKGAIPTKTNADAKITIQEMAKYSQKWHNETSSKAKSIETSNGLAAIQAWLNNFGRAIKKSMRKYTLLSVRILQRNNRNSSYPNRRQILEESLTKFIAESANRNEENLNIIKEIRSLIDAVIRNQEASIKTLGIKIGHMSKVLQERGIGGIPGLTEPNPTDHVKSISTTKVDSSKIHRMGCSTYSVSRSQHRSIFSKTVPFSTRLQDYCYDDWRETQDVKILEADDHC